MPQAHNEKTGQKGKKNKHNFSQVAVCHSSMPTRLASALSLPTVNILVRLLTRWRGALDLYHCHNTAAHSLAGVSRLIPMTGLPHTSSEAHRRLLSRPTGVMADLVAFPSGIGEVS